MASDKQIEKILYLLSIEDRGEFDQSEKIQPIIPPQKLSQHVPISSNSPSPSIKSSKFSYWERNNILDHKIYEQISYAQSISEMKTILESITGYYLKDTAKNTVIGTGNPDSPLMLIGEAPGADEDLKGEPFVGHSGKMLQALLDFAGFFRSKIYITNIVPWRPENNRTPTNLEIQSCIPFIIKHIQIIKPKYILMLGTVACKALLNNTEIKITKTRGQWFTQTFPGMSDTIELIATYHPSFLLRQPRQKKYFWRDVMSVKAKVNM